jgi:glucose-1-phosphate adenylyltransferase
LDSGSWKIYSKNPVLPPQYISETAKISNSYITEGCEISGKVEHSVISAGVTVEEGAVIRDSIIFGGVHIGAGAIVYKSVIGANTFVSPGAKIGCNDDDANTDFINEKICTDNITLLGGNIVIDEKIKIKSGSMVVKNVMTDAEKGEE